MVCTYLGFTQKSEDVVLRTGACARAVATAELSNPGAFTPRLSGGMPSMALSNPTCASSQYELADEMIANGVPEACRVYVGIQFPDDTHRLHLAHDTWRHRGAELHWLWAFQADRGFVSLSRGSYRLESAGP
jgi:hypothetical protein